MLATEAFGGELQRKGFSFYTGVPCSFLKDLINYALNECRCVSATNEGDAVAIAAGAMLGGAKPVVYLQNSGLGNAVSPLTSLNYVFKIPVLMLVSLRGEAGVADEPQHELMGAITTSLLDTMKIGWEYLSKDPAEMSAQVARADAQFQAGKPFCFVVKKATFAGCELRQAPLERVVNEHKLLRSREASRPAREEALRALTTLRDTDTAFLATTGFTGRELYQIEDVPNHFYMVGSMGCLSSTALGLSMVRPDKNIVAIDGDGAFLMRMGSMAASGTYGPPNLLHVLLDNNAHESTGGQATVSKNVNFVEIAAACGYRNAVYVHDISELHSVAHAWKRNKKLTFVHLETGLGSMSGLGRPKVNPAELAQRFRAFLQ